MSKPAKGWQRWLLGAAALAAIAVAVAAWAYFQPLGHQRGETPGAPSKSLLTDELVQQVRDFCGACHAFPPPEALPRSAWSYEVEHGFEFLRRTTDLSYLHVPPKIAAER